MQLSSGILTDAFDLTVMDMSLDCDDDIVISAPGVNAVVIFVNTNPSERGSFQFRAVSGTATGVRGVRINDNIFIRFMRGFFILFYFILVTGIASIHLFCFIFMLF